MSFKCPICTKTFSQRSSYSQHVQKCIKKADVENEDVVEMDTKSDKYSDNENNNVEVIMLFQVISYKALKPKKSSAMLAHLASNYLLCTNCMTLGGR